MVRGSDRDFSKKSGRGKVKVLSADEFLYGGDSVDELKGKVLEDLLVNFLKEYCDIERGEELDRVYKLDFIVRRFHNIGKYIDLGVQVTGYLDNYVKMMEFRNVRRLGGMVRRSLYIEVDSFTDMENWGYCGVLGAIKGFVFDKRFTDVDIYGVRINGDFSYSYFDLSERIDELVERNFKSGGLNFIDGKEYEGYITRYFVEKGYGFIWGIDGSGGKGSVFFNIKDTATRELGERIIKVLGESERIIKVRYKLILPVISEMSSRIQAYITDIIEG